MKIGYKKVWGILCLMLSGLSCCLVVAFNQTGEAIPLAIVGVFWLFFVLGILLLTRSYVEVWKEILIIKPLIGSGVKRYSYQSSKDFSIEEDEVLLINNGTRQKLPVSKWLVDKRGWTSFLEWIKAGQ
ncbi:MAG: hypothetical protein IPP55_01820 [Anaerolineales bacterium]|nr:hypothetical protein [Anaerolineales bacterium]